MGRWEGGARRVRCGKLSFRISGSCVIVDECESRPNRCRIRANRTLDCRSYISWALPCDNGKLGECEQHVFVFRLSRNNAFIAFARILRLALLQIDQSESVCRIEVVGIELQRFLETGPGVFMIVQAKVYGPFEVVGQGVVGLFCLERLDCRKCLVESALPQVRGDQRDICLVLRRLGLRQRFEVFECPRRVASSEAHLREANVACNVALVNGVGAFIALRGFDEISGREIRLACGPQQRRVVRGPLEAFFKYLDRLRTLARFQVGEPQHPHRVQLAGGQRNNSAQRFLGRGIRSKLIIDQAGKVQGAKIVRLLGEYPLHRVASMDRIVTRE